MSSALAGFDEGVVAFKAGNYELALKEFKPLAEQGDAKAQSNLGLMYESGFGVEKNYQEAINWYRQAANQGLAEAQFNLGVMYQNGIGVEKNYQEAINWYRQAANQGFAKAQVNLGGMYFNGFGVEKNYQEAINWYRKAANQGFANAQLNLGVMYLGGQGVAKNQVIAYSLFNLSLKNSTNLKGVDSKSVKVRRDLCAAEMTSQQIQIAEQLTQKMANSNNVTKVIDDYLKQAKE